MAYSRAIEVANLIRTMLLPGVMVSVGESVGGGQLEVVVRGFRDPEDGMSRVWYVDLIGPSGMELDLTITALRKLGFDLTGASPLITGRLSQPLTRDQLNLKTTKAAAEKQAVDRANLKAEIAAETSIATAGIEELRDEVERLKQLIEDMALMPQPRGPVGPAGEAGRDGLDGVPLQLNDASISDLGDVSGIPPEEQNVLTWVNGEWTPAKPKFTSISSIAGGGGGGGGTSLTVQSRNRENLTDEPTNVVENVAALSFDTDSGFVVEELPDGTQEAFIKLNSTFNPWHVDGQDELDATGEEPVEFVAGAGVEIITDATSEPKKIIFKTTGDAGLQVPTTIGPYPEHYANLVVDLATGEIVAVQPYEVISPE